MAVTMLETMNLSFFWQSRYDAQLNDNLRQEARNGPSIRVDPSQKVFQTAHRCHNESIKMDFWCCSWHIQLRIGIVGGGLAGMVTAMDLVDAGNGFMSIHFPIASLQSSCLSQKSPLNHPLKLLLARESITTHPFEREVLASRT